MNIVLKNNQTMLFMAMLCMHFSSWNQ